MVSFNPLFSLVACSTSRIKDCSCPGSCFIFPMKWIAIFSLPDHGTGKKIQLLSFQPVKSRKKRISGKRSLRRSPGTFTLLSWGIQPWAPLERAPLGRQLPPTSIIHSHNKSITCISIDTFANHWGKFHTSYTLSHTPPIYLYISKQGFEESKKHTIRYSTNTNHMDIEHINHPSSTNHTPTHT